MGITYRGRVGKVAGFRLIANITVLTWETGEDLGSHLGGLPLSIPLEITATNTREPTIFVISAGLLPPGLSLVNGVISGSPTNLASSNSFTIKATNNHTVSERTFSLEVDLNAAPVWTTAAGPLGSFIEEDAAYIQLVATDPEAYPVEFSVVSGDLPDGWEMSNAGTITGVADDSVDTYTFTVRADDGVAHADRAFSIDIGPNENPAWVSPAGGSLGSVLDTANTFTRTFVAEDPEERGVTYSVSSGALPGDLSLNANTGVLSGLFQPVVGTQVFNFNIRASDGVKFTDRSFSLSVEHDVGPVWVTPANLGTFLSDTTLNTTVVATDANNSAVTYAAANGTTFPGMVAVSNSGLLSGLLPTVSNSTGYTFAIVASDGVLSNSRTFSLTVRPNSAPVWVTGASQGPFTQNVAISNIVLQATDVDGDTVTYALSNATSLPTGLSLSNGVISGTPTVISSNTFTIKASDGLGGDAYRTFTANVAAATTYVSSNGTLTSTVPKPSGLAVDDYMFIFVAHGDASVQSGGDGNWLKSTLAWTSYGYTSTLLHKRVSLADVNNSITITGISTNGMATTAYRGVVNAVVTGTTIDAGGTTLNLARAAKQTLSLGQVGFTADRDPSGTPQPPSGWTGRQQYTGQYFQMTTADRVDGTQPAGSGTDTFTNYTSGFDQVGFAVQLLADDSQAFPAMTASVMPGGYIATSSDNAYGPNYYAFDQNNGTFWGTNVAATGWLQIQFPANRTITNYFFRNRTGFTNQTPTSWQFQGSNDGSSFTTLDTRTGVSFTDGGENSYTVASPGSYRYYRLQCTGNTNNGTIAIVAGLRFTFA